MLTDEACNYFYEYYHNDCILKFVFRGISLFFFLQRLKVTAIAPLTIRLRRWDSGDADEFGVIHKT